MLITLRIFIDSHWLYAPQTIMLFSLAENKIFQGRENGDSGNARHYRRLNGETCFRWRRTGTEDRRSKFTPIFLLHLICSGDAERDAMWSIEMNASCRRFTWQTVIVDHLISRRFAMLRWMSVDVHEHGDPFHPLHHWVSCLIIHIDVLVIWSAIHEILFWALLVSS